MIRIFPGSHATHDPSFAKRVPGQAEHEALQRPMRPGCMPGKSWLWVDEKCHFGMVCTLSGLPCCWLFQEYKVGSRPCPHGLDIAQPRTCEARVAGVPEAFCIPGAQGTHVVRLVMVVTGVFQQDRLQNWSLLENLPFMQGAPLGIVMVVALTPGSRYLPASQRVQASTVPSSAVKRPASHTCTQRPQHGCRTRQGS